MRRARQLLRHVGGRRELPREIADRGASKRSRTDSLTPISREIAATSFDARVSARRSKKLSVGPTSAVPSSSHHGQQAPSSTRAGSADAPSAGAAAARHRRGGGRRRQRRAGGLAVELRLAGADGEGGGDHPVLRHRVRRQLTACGVAQRAEPAALVGRRRRRRRRVRRT